MSCWAWMFDSCLKRDYKSDLACSAAALVEPALILSAAARAEPACQITKAMEANYCCSLLPALAACWEPNSPCCCWSNHCLNCSALRIGCPHWSWCSCLSYCSCCWPCSCLSLCSSYSYCLLWTGFELSKCLHSDWVSNLRKLICEKIFDLIWEKILYSWLIHVGDGFFFFPYGYSM